MGSSAIGKLAVVVADYQLSFIKVIELPVPCRTINAAAIAEAQVDKSRCNPSGGQVADDVEGVRFALTRNGFSIKKVRFNSEYLERAAAQGEETTFARINAIKGYLTKRGRIDSATFEELVDLMIGQYHIDYVGRFLGLFLEFCCNAGAEIDDLGFLPQDTLDKSTHGDHRRYDAHQIGQKFGVVTFNQVNYRRTVGRYHRQFCLTQRFSITVSNHAGTIGAFMHLEKAEALQSGCQLTGSDRMEEGRE